MTLLTSARLLSSNPAPTYTGPLRSFQTSFESLSEYAALGFYNEDGTQFDSSWALASAPVKDGSKSYQAWILRARDADNDSTYGYLPHRAYPTFQFQKTAQGIFRTPSLVSLWVYLDLPPLQVHPGQIDDWFSVATLTPDATDAWARTVTVNLTPDGYIRLVNVPLQGQQVFLEQANAANDPTGALRFPLRQWVRLDILIDFSSTSGYARVWQNQTLVSSALVEGGNGGLAQAHFGLYASAAVASGTVYNDKLRIQEVHSEAEALSLVNSSW